MTPTKGTWTKGEEVITGSWEYYKPSDVFHIWLDSIDPITGQRRTVTTHRDTPEWGEWKLGEAPRQELEEK